MRKILVFVLYLVTTFSFAQGDLSKLKFDTKYYEAVDKWVAFPNSKSDSSFTFGFIYLDQHAGFTFEYSSTFIVRGEILETVPKGMTESIKLRLAPNTARVAILSPDQIIMLGLPTIPDWLANYKQENSVAYLKNIGFHYNHVGASSLALEPLTQAYKQEPHHDGLEFELAYAYNAQKRYADAISVLQKAITNNSQNHYFYRELGYAYRYNNQLDLAEKVYSEGIRISTDSFVKSEMAVNMAQAYFQIRDRKKFNKWAALTRQYADKGSQYAHLIDAFEKKWSDK